MFDKLDRLAWILGPFLVILLRINSCIKLQEEAEIERAYQIQQERGGAYEQIYEDPTDFSEYQNSIYR